MGALKTTKIFLPVAALFIALTFCLDAPVRTFVDAHQTVGSVHLASLISQYGEWQWLMFGLVIGFGIAAWKRSADWKRLFITMMIVCSLSGLIVDVIRGVSGRARPNSGEEPGWYGMRHDGHWLITNGRFNSFPSGHTAVATGLLAPLFVLRRRAAWLFVPVPVIIALARVYQNAHHPSDVAASAVIAFATAWLWVRYGASYVPTAFRPPEPASNTSRLTGQTESL